MDSTNNENRNMQLLQDKCKKCMHYHVVLTMVDGSVLDGIIEAVEPERIIVLVGEDVMEQQGAMPANEQREFYGGRPPRRRMRRRFRRFRRRGIPFRNLAALALLRYPFYAPPYPYYYNDNDYDYDDYYDDYDD